MFLLLQVYIVTDDGAEDEWTSTATELGMLGQLVCSPLSAQVEDER